MAQLLRQGTSVAIHIGPALTTGGLAVQTAITTTGTAKRILKHLATAAVTVTGAITHISVGHYRMTLGTGHTGTLGHLTVAITATAGTNKCLPMWQKYMVVPANVFDSLVSGSDKLDVNAAQYAGAATATGDFKTLAQIAGAVWGATVARALTSGAVIWTAAGRGLTSKVGFALTSGQHDTIGTRTWAVTARVLTSGGTVWDALRANHVASGSYGRLMGPGTVVRESTLQSGAAQSVVLDAAAATGNGAYSFMTLVLVSGTGAGQTRLIDSYAGATKRANVSEPFTTTPGGTTKFMILARGPAVVGWVDTDGTTRVARSVWDEAAASHTASGSFGLGVKLVTGAGGQQDLVSRVWSKTITDVTGAPAGSAASTKLSFLYVGARYKRVTTATGDKLHSSASAVIAKAPISASTTVFTKGKFVTATG